MFKMGWNHQLVVGVGFNYSCSRCSIKEDPLFGGSPISVSAQRMWLQAIYNWTKPLLRDENRTIVTTFVDPSWEPILLPISLRRLWRYRSANQSSMFERSSKDPVETWKKHSGCLGCHRGYTTLCYKVLFYTMIRNRNPYSIARIQWKVISVFFSLLSWQLLYDSTWIQCRFMTP